MRTFSEDILAGCLKVMVRVRIMVRIVVMSFTVMVRGLGALERSMPMKVLTSIEKGVYVYFSISDKVFILHKGTCVLSCSVILS